jgi:outer membrane cobalamin receptor
VSVFVDGVRVNEADASQVHPSLIPSEAIERIELVRGRWASSARTRSPAL